MAVDRLKIALAIRSTEDASRIELLLSGDGYDPVAFRSARELWSSFGHIRPRIVIADRRFEGDFSGLDLSRSIREYYAQPFVYVLLLSRLNSLNEIEEGLDAGVNDYLIKPHNPFQIRSRIRVALRWLGYVDFVLDSGAQQA
jgi:DNA-binding response OmpR family regulator